MTNPRFGNASMVPGALAPRKYNKLITEYPTALLTVYQFFHNDVAVGYTEVECDAQDREIRSEYFAGAYVP